MLLFPLLTLLMCTLSFTPVFANNHVVQTLNAATLELFIFSENDIEMFVLPEDLFLTEGQKDILKNLHKNGNFIGVIDRSIGLNFNYDEIVCLFYTISSLLYSGLEKKRQRTLKYFRNFEKYRSKFKSEFVEELHHSILIDPESGKTGLMLVIEKQDDEIFNLFLSHYLKQNCPINAQNYEKKTALDIAREKGTLHMIQALEKIIEC